MRTILVVCGAGASSTFLALAMRRLAAARELPVRIEPVGEAQLPARLPDADAVLIGPHLAARFPALSAQATAHHAAAVQLADGNVGAPGAERALASALAALDLPPEQPDEAGSARSRSGHLHEPSTITIPPNTRTE